MLRCINWLEVPEFGEVYLKRVGYNPPAFDRSTPMSERELAQIRTRIGMVFQHFNLWPHMTVLGNVTESPIHVQKRARTQVVAEAEQLLEKVGLSDKRDEYPSRLSGGQKQLVAIARALAMKPDVILFDEPTSAFDPELVGDVLSVISNLANEGMTTIIATHEMKFAQDVADQIVFLDQGKVIETGSPKNFFSNPTTDRACQFLERYWA